MDIKLQCSPLSWKNETAQYIPIIIPVTWCPKNRNIIVRLSKGWSLSYPAFKDPAKCTVAIICHIKRRWNTESRSSKNGYPWENIRMNEVYGVVSSVYISPFCFYFKMKPKKQYTVHHFDAILVIDLILTSGKAIAESTNEKRLCWIVQRSCISLLYWKNFCSAHFYSYFAERKGWRKSSFADRII